MGGSQSSITPAPVLSYNGYHDIPNNAAVNAIFTMNGADDDGIIMYGAEELGVSTNGGRRLAGNAIYNNQNSPPYNGFNYNIQFLNYLPEETNQNLAGFNVEIKMNGLSDKEAQIYYYLVFGYPLIGITCVLIAKCLHDRIYTHKSTWFIIILLFLP